MLPGELKAALLRAARHRRAASISEASQDQRSRARAISGRRACWIARRRSRLAGGHHRPCMRRWPHLHPALARRPRLAFFAAAGRCGASRALGDTRQDQDLHRRRLCRVSGRGALQIDEIAQVVADYAQAAENAKRGRLRRRRNSWRQWLSDRPVPQRRHQQAHRLHMAARSKTARVSRSRSSTRGPGLGQIARRHQAIAGDQVPDIGDSNPEPVYLSLIGQTRSGGPRLYPRHRGRYRRRAPPRRRLRPAEAAARVRRALHRQQQL